MCGIAGVVGDDQPRVTQMLDRLAHRGPDARGVAAVDGVTIGHVRLAIIDPTPASDQPLRWGPVTLCFNGEIWNYRELRSRLRSAGHVISTAGDTEVLAAWLALYGPAGIDDIDGMFALAWVHDGEGAWLARDRYGEIPLHLGVDADNRLCWASELKALRGCIALRHVQPGHLVDLQAQRAQAWYELPEGAMALPLEQAAEDLRGYMAAACAKRAAAADVPTCTLLSGGIDSAAIAVELRAHLPDLVAYTAVLNRRSRDLTCARSVADDLGLKLVEVPVEPPTADDLARVVVEIEQPHKAQVEIAWACLALAEAMRADGFRVTYSGEGSDELWASYGQSYHGIARYGWNAYRHRLVRDQARKNFARANKVFMARSVEVRLPFCDRFVVEHALSLPRSAVVSDGHPKAILASAYADSLSRQICERPKLAFQDGLGLKVKAAAAVAAPKRFYAVEYERRYGRYLAPGVLP
jgi:asparagine synthase (glutamine-hydrolysing)